MIRRRASALALVAVALASVSAACGAGLPEGSPASENDLGSALPADASATDILDAAREAMAQVSSYRFSGSTLSRTFETASLTFPLNPTSL